jgi:hypothetical protein
MGKLAILLIAAGALVFGAVGISAPSSKDDLLKDEQHFYAQSQKTYNGGSKAGSASNIELVGHNNLTVRGFNADVWKYKNYAYVGHWGFADWATGNDRFCPSPPNSGVAVIDVSNPATRREWRRSRTRPEPPPKTWSSIRRRTGRSRGTTSPRPAFSGAAVATTTRTRSTG